MKAFSPSSPPRSVLFTVFKGIGDVILTTPLLRAVKKTWPSCKTYFFTRPASAKVLSLNPNVDAVVLRGGGALSAIRALRPEVAVDFMLSSVSGFYTLFSGAGTRLAFYRPHGRLFYNLMPPPADRGYAVSNRLALLEPLGIRPDGIEPDLFFSPENESRAGAFLSSAGLKPGSFVTLDITSPRAHRQWPAASFAKLADLLEERLGLRCVFLWGPGEKDYVGAAAAACSRPHVVAPSFDLLDLAALSRKALLHAGTTSAPMHIAVSQGTPTFTVYGLVNGPRGWEPPSPLHAHAAGDLEALKPEEVFEKLAAHVASLPAGRRP